MGTNLQLQNNCVLKQNILTIELPMDDGRTFLAFIEPTSISGIKNQKQADEAARIITETIGNYSSEKTALILMILGFDYLVNVKDVEIQNKVA